MVKKSITVDIEKNKLKDLHKEALDLDLSRKFFIEECINFIADDKKILEKVKDRIRKK